MKKSFLKLAAVLAASIATLTLTASIFTGPPTAGGGGSITTPVSIANGGTGVATARDASTAIGVFQMSPAGGNDAFADMQAATPNFADQYGFSAYGSQLEYMWWATGTSQSNWSSSFAMPGHIEVGDPTHMLTNDVHENTFVVNGVPNPAGLSVPSDNVIGVRNMNTSHFSAIRYLDDAGQEQGAVGWGNSGASIFTSIMYLESFGAGHGFFFTSAGGGISFGMEKTTTDLVCLYPGQQTDGYNATNVMFRVVHNTGAVSNFGNYTVGKLIFAGSGAQQITLASGKLNASSFDATQGGTVPLDASTIDALSFVALTPTLTKTSFDVSGNGTGMAGTNSTSDLYLMRAASQKVRIQADEIDFMVTTAKVSNIFVTNATSGVLGTLAPASTTNLVVDFNSPDEQSITLTANANLIQSTNRTAAVWNRHTVWLYPNGTNRTVTFNSSWHTNGFFSTTITLTNTTVASVVFACNGSAETNVFAVYTTWP